MWLIIGHIFSLSIIILKNNNYVEYLDTIYKDENDLLNEIKKYADY